MAAIVEIGRWIFWCPLRKLMVLMGHGRSSILERFLSFTSYHALRRRREDIKQELRQSVGSEWSSDLIEKAVRATFDVQIGSQVRMFHIPTLNSSNIDNYISADGLEYLDEALAGRKGAILLNPHFGPFMLLMPALAYRGYKLHQIALQGEPPWGKRKGISKRIYEIKFQTIEGNLPVAFINAAGGAFALRSAYKALKKNEILLYPSTGRGGTAWHTVPFMRRKAAFSVVPFKIATSSGAPLFPAFVVLESQRARVILERPIRAEADSTPESLMEEYVKVLDAYVTRYPGHILMFIHEIQQRSLQGQKPFFTDT